MTEFMTAASVKNLPQYLLDDRKRTESRRAAEDKQQMEEQKKIMTDIAYQINQVNTTAKTPEESQAGISQIMNKYKDSLSPELLQFSREAANSYKNNFRKDKEYQRNEKLLDQTDKVNMLIDKEYLKDNPQPEGTDPRVARLFGQQQAANKAAQDKLIQSGQTSEQKNFLFSQKNPEFKDYLEQEEKTKNFAPSSLKKLMTERQELKDSGLPDDHPDVKAYDNKITGVDIDVEDMSNDEISTFGAYFNATGKMPSLGRGKQSTKIRQAIAKSAARQALGAEKDGVPDVANKTPAEAAFSMIGEQSDTKAIQGSLNFLDKQLSSMGSFVTNLNSQIDRVGELSKDLETFDTRILNAPLRAVRGRIKGSALQAKYDLFLSEIESEIGKLATGSTGSVAELSASAQEKWAKIHDKNLSVKDMLSLLEETKHAANFRVNSVRDQLDKTRERMRNRGVDIESIKNQENSKSGATQSQFTEGQTATGPNGEKIVYKNGAWGKL